VDKVEWDKSFGAFRDKGGVAAVRLGGRGEVTGSRVRWRYSKSLPYLPSPLLYQGVLYIVRDGGILTALHPQNGAVLRQDRLQDALDKYYAASSAW
jgi:hypothetical protein